MRYLVISIVLVLGACAKKPPVQNAQSKPANNAAPADSGKASESAPTGGAAPPADQPRSGVPKDSKTGDPCEGGQ